MTNTTQPRFFHTTTITTLRDPPESNTNSSSHSPQEKITEEASATASTADHNTLFWYKFGNHHLSENDPGTDTQYENQEMKVQSPITAETEIRESTIFEKNNEERIEAAGSPSLSTTLTHVTNSGEARMVDVSGKAVTRREAVARAEVALGAAAFQLVKENRAKKGDVLGVARVAGIMAAKKTSDLIPLCHPLPLDTVEMTLTLRGESQAGPDYVVLIEAKAVTSGRTGVEMEALVAASVAALTVYDMCKAVSHAITISSVRLVSKSGGKKDYFSG